MFVSKCKYNRIIFILVIMNQLFDKKKLFAYNY